MFSINIRWLITIFIWSFLLLCFVLCFFKSFFHYFYLTEFWSSSFLSGTGIGSCSQSLTSYVLSVKILNIEETVCYFKKKIKKRILSDFPVGFLAVSDHQILESTSIVKMTLHITWLQYLETFYLHVPVFLYTSLFGNF